VLERMSDALRLVPTGEASGEELVLVVGYG
jgi:hypothetical protein